MVEFCSEPEGVEGLNEGSIEEWRDLRTRFIEKTRRSDVPKQFHLSDGYFDNLTDHGLLPLLPASQLPPPSSNADIETGVYQPADMGSASNADDNQSL